MIRTKKTERSQKTSKPDSKPEKRELEAIRLSPNKDFDVRPICDFMTHRPITIEASKLIVDAEKLMIENRLRHLPVLHKGNLIGILMERDVNLSKNFKAYDPKTFTVLDGYMPMPYTTSSKTPIADVCSFMAANKFPCVLILENKKLVGIFTWVDGLKLVAKYFAIPPKES